MAKTFSAAGIALAMITLIAGNSLGDVNSVPPPHPVILPPPVIRQFRGEWIATVANSDWPSKPGLPVAQQKQELLNILNTAQKDYLNTIVLQVRPASDALYASTFEPWSYFLTGKQGEPPIPFYDPLEFAIHEAHKRGLALQAWFNPFRAYFPGEKGGPASNSVIEEHPDWIVHYGNQTWLNPGLPAVQKYVLKVMLDVVKRYNLDGIQIDDYFYPYPIEERSGYLHFDDDAAYHRYLHLGGKLDLGDWRRENINHFIHDLYDEVKAVKPYVLVGISPFGIWRPGHPSTIKGYDAYSRIYCDSRLWLHRGWLDYLAPQLYWKISQPAQSFPVLLNWWLKQNLKNRHIWPGLFSDLVTGSGHRGPWPSQEITDQIAITQTFHDARGACLFSSSSLEQSRNLSDALRKLYSGPALPPSSPWLGAIAPKMPILMVGKTLAGSETAVWKSEALSLPPRFWVEQVLTPSGWQTSILPDDCTSTELPPLVSEVAISAIGASGLQSPPAIFTNH